MQSEDILTIIDKLRRELRSDAAFRKLTEEHQAWLVERFVTGDYGTYAQLSATLAQRSGSLICTSALYNLRAAILKRLGSIEGLRNARRDIVDRLTAGAAIGTDIENLARTAIPGITNALAGALGDRAIDLIVHGKSDPDAVRDVLNDFLAAAAGARADRDLSRKEEEVALQRQRFQRETCDLFLRWCADQRASQIASSQSSNADKIERLGQLMFGDEWK